MSWRWLLLSLDILIDVLWRTPLDQQLNVEYDMRLNLFLKISKTDNTFLEEKYK